MSLREFWEGRVERYREKGSLYSQNQQITYGELDRKANQITNGFLELGILRLLEAKINVQEKGEGDLFERVKKECPNHQHVIALGVSHSDAVRFIPSLDRQGGGWQRIPSKW